MNQDKFSIDYVHKTKLYQALASTIMAQHTCAQRPVDTEQYKVWRHKHADHIDHLARNFLPSGSGFDSGTKVDLDHCETDKLVLTFGFHHMDAWGGYCGWSNHTVTITPSLVFEIELDFSSDEDYNAQRQEDFEESKADYLHENPDDPECDYAELDYYDEESFLDMCHQIFHTALTESKPHQEWYPNDKS
jgi:hypothetical protein